MRIAVLLSSHSCLDERVVFKQAASLVRMGHEVIVIAPDSPDDQAVKKVQYVSLNSSPGGGLLTRAARLPALLREAVRSGANIYSCHEPESALIGLLARSRTSACVVFDVHECYEETLSGRVGGWKGTVIRWFSRKMMEFLGRRSNWITTVSPPLRDFYRAVRYDGRAEILYNSPIVNSFPLCDQADREKLLVCHDGIISLNRGIGQMLDAVAIARAETDVRLQLVGQLADDCRAMFYDKIESLDLTETVELSGWLPYAEVGPRLARGQVGTVALQPSPNNYRGLGNKIFNYMCCGLACVAPANSATGRLVQEAKCGLAVDVTDPRAIAGAWVRLAKDGDLRRRLARNGRLAIERQYGWHNMEKVLGRVYSQVASSALP